ncbi:MAG: tricarballylate utilization 4Fe-4S protein TcuB [Acidobacteriia bacterium]|nr:tricarballylate utilization 4Fe-4S protein TcuB [Terriglobia bacterium]
MPPDNKGLFVEGDRLMTICNACRYCEGYCAVFPAMERRTAFEPADLRYLANLCHNCAECYYACQYAPPHEFAINVPRNLAEIRVESYAHYAWPRAFGAAYRANGMLIFVLLTSAIAAALIGGMQIAPPARAADFYGIIPHEKMVGLFGAIAAFVAIALAIGVRRFWRESSGGPVGLAMLRSAAGDVLKLRYLGSGGAGCTYPDEHHSLARRRFHHLTFYGFALCFASTSVAAVYHSIFGWHAPYGYFSLPVVLGAAGGIGLLAGPAGLFWLKVRHDPRTGDPRQKGLDYAFISILFVTSLTGLLLLILRGSEWMPALLSVHLAAVAVMFLTLPYGKFVHGIYRSAALLRDAAERMQYKTN